MKLRFTPRAVKDIEQIADYIIERNPNAARRVRLSIFESLQHLLIFPHIGKRQKTADVRKYTMPHYGFLIYYLIEAAREEIVVLAIKHSKQVRPYSDT